MKITKNIRNLILILVFAPIIFLSCYLLFDGYIKLYNKSKHDILLSLSGIAKTTSLQIEGDKHELLLQLYKNKDEIKTNTQDSLYQSIHHILKDVYTINELKTSVYTLVLDSITRKVYFAVSSSDKPYFKHSYEAYHESLVENFTKGGEISFYEDENGKWLSAFYPIKNKIGKTVAVVEVDQNFNHFASELVSQLYQKLILTLFLIAIVITITFKILNKILKTQEKTFIELETKNTEINSSINYAKRIIDASLYSINELNKIVPELYVFYKPRDIVGGDFYYFYPIEIKNNICTKYLIGIFDCTGHGVPGAILSILGTSSINHIVKNSTNYAPEVILDKMNKEITATLKQEEENSKNNDGMEGALCLVDIEKLNITFAGAKRHLFHVDSQTNELKEIKGIKFSLGGNQTDKEKVFTSHSININKGDSIYLTTDGIGDQFTLINNQERKVGSKKIKEFLMAHSHLKIQDQYTIIDNQFTKWKGNLHQLDDVTVIGLKI